MRRHTARAQHLAILGFDVPPTLLAFLKRMAELGYQEGRNFTFDYIQTPDIEGYERN